MHSTKFPQLYSYILVRGTHRIENEVTDNHQVHCSLAAENWKHVCWHALPEVDQEILNLRKFDANNYYKAAESRLHAGKTTTVI